MSCKPVIIHESLPVTQKQELPIKELIVDMERLETVGNSITKLAAYQVYSYLKYVRKADIPADIWSRVCEFLEEDYSAMPEKVKEAIPLGSLQKKQCNLKVCKKEAEYDTAVHYLYFIPEYADRLLRYFKKSSHIEVFQEAV